MLLVNSWVLYCGMQAKSICICTYDGGLLYNNADVKCIESFIHPSTRTNFYMYSFYPKTIKQWNSLSSDMASAQSPAEFHKLITNKLTCN